MLNGKIIREELKVQLQLAWPDYVFDKDYDLPSLEEVEKHIKEKGDLINIPSGKEVEENDIQLGKMNKVLLEKIEELTPYNIQQDKSQKQIEERIKILEAQKITNLNNNIIFQMNKLTLPIAVLALVVSVASYFLLQSNSELVYVDVNQLLDGYNRTKVERSAFDKKTNVLKSNVDSLVTNWQSELKAYEKERASMTKKEIELKQQLLSNKQQQLNNYQQAIQKQIQEEDQKMTQTVINDINDYVKEYGKSNGYPIIFGAGGTGNIMYAEEASDLTAKILEGLNAQYEGK